MPTLTRIRRTEETGGGGIGSRHLLEDGDEEAHLDLGAALEERVERGGSFGFGEDSKPLLDRRELLLEVGVERSGGHVLEGRLVVLEVREPSVDRCKRKRGATSVVAKIDRISPGVGE